MLVAIVTVKLSDPNLPIVARDALESHLISFPVWDCRMSPQKLEPHGDQHEQTNDCVLIDQIQ
jgi:hypothetical protein